jgi:hypothetical protein
LNAHTGWVEFYLLAEGYLGPFQVSSKNTGVSANLKTYFGRKNIAEMEHHSGREREI